jgi:hypothetical protein
MAMNADDEAPQESTDASKSRTNLTRLLRSNLFIQPSVELGDGRSRGHDDPSADLVDDQSEGIIEIRKSTWPHRRLPHRR